MGLPSVTATRAPEAGIIMLAGSDLIMTGLAVAVAASLLTGRGKPTAPPADLAAYNARLASLEAPEAR